MENSFISFDSAAWLVQNCSQDFDQNADITQIAHKLMEKIAILRADTHILGNDFSSNAQSFTIDKIKIMLHFRELFSKEDLNEDQKKLILEAVGLHDRLPITTFQDLEYYYPLSRLGRQGCLVFDRMLCLFVFKDVVNKASIFVYDQILKRLNHEPSSMPLPLYGIVHLLPKQFLANPQELQPDDIQKIVSKLLPTPDRPYSHLLSNSLREAFSLENIRTLKMLSFEKPRCVQRLLIPFMDPNAFLEGLELALAHLWAKRREFSQEIIDLEKNSLKAVDLFELSKTDIYTIRSDLSSIFPSKLYEDYLLALAEVFDQFEPEKPFSIAETILIYVKIRRKNQAKLLHLLASPLGELPSLADFPSLVAKLPNEIEVHLPLFESIIHKTYPGIFSHFEDPKNECLKLLEVFGVSPTIHELFAMAYKGKGEIKLTLLLAQGNEESLILKPAEAIALMNCSNFFKKLLTDTRFEANRSIMIEQEDWDFLVGYALTGEADITDETVFSIFSLADQYDMPDLISKVEEWLISIRIDWACMALASGVFDEQRVKQLQQGEIKARDYLAIYKEFEVRLPRFVQKILPLFQDKIGL